eukprot:13216_3
MTCKGECLEREQSGHFLPLSNPILVHPSTRLHRSHSSAQLTVAPIKCERSSCISDPANTPDVLCPSSPGRSRIAQALCHRVFLGSPSFEASHSPSTPCEGSCDVDGSCSRLPYMLPVCSILSPSRLSSRQPSPCPCTSRTCPTIFFDQLPSALESQRHVTLAPIPVFVPSLMRFRRHYCMCS